VWLRFGERQYINFGVGTDQEQERRIREIRIVREDDLSQRGGRKREEVDAEATLKKNIVI
jgi:hypothetical protein